MNMFSRYRIYILHLTACVFLLASCKQDNKLFTVLSPSETNITFENKLEKRPLLNILYYLYYYNGGGVATGDINNDGLPDVYFTANSKGNNKLYLNKGNLQFEDITQKAGVSGNADWCSGVTMADVNADGFLDIYVSAVAGSFNLNGHNELYINNGNGTFSERSAEYGLNFSGLATQAAFFDYDHDGDLDCYLLNHSKKPHANIVDTANRRKVDPTSGDRLYRNDLNTAKKFTDVSAQAGIYQSNLGYGLGLSIADINNDGWEDIFVGNDFHENDYYYINNHDGTFSESGEKHFYHYSRFSMGNDVADFDNDGQLDIFTSDMLPPDEKVLKTYGSDENPDIYTVKLKMNGYQHQYSKNCLQRNNGNGKSFSDVSLMSGVSATDWTWCPLFADFDNDGNKDLFITSGIVKRPVDLDYIRFVSDMQMKGLDKTDELDQTVIDKMPDGSSYPFFFKGDGSLLFSDVSDSWGTKDLKGYFNGASYADLDNDGDLDLITNCIDAPALVLRNNTPKKNYLSLSFKGNGGNTMGIGAKAYLFANGKMQYQQLMLTRGFESSSDTRLHFGLDSIATIDSLLIVWPDQKYQVIRKLNTNKPLIVNQSEASGLFDAATYFEEKPFQIGEQFLSASWKHQEDDFLDYNVQYLIPHSQSTRGPKIAVGDVNGDGLDDFYACGAIGQGGALMIQQAAGNFIQTDSAVFNKDAASEDVDATFFDANGDGTLDLYVVSGGNRYLNSAPELLDRLYINDGKGHFTKDAKALPGIATNKSCVATADVDKDGDMDLFVGTLADPKAYGLPQSSQLLINNGKGQFAVAPNQQIALSNIGIVTSAAFADINKDGWSDLVVTGEWMPVKIYLNQKGQFTATDLPQSTGLWQTIHVTDVNGDGFPDLLAGNWGHNTKLFAGKNGPCKLYVKDFDKNGSIEQVLCYSIDGKEYTFLVKDELERSMPVLKKYYLTYDEVAGKTVDFLLYDLFEDYLELKAEVLSSSCFINDGKGGYKRMDLPSNLQMSPVMSLASLPFEGQATYMAGGNFYGVTPYEGRYDALQPTIFSFNRSNTNFLVSGILPEKNSEIRDMKRLKTADGNNLLVIARNNEALQFLKLPNQPTAHQQTK